MTDPMHNSLRSDRGFMLIEVLVSATLLVVVVLAVMGAMDNAESRAGAQQKRAVAANLAQAELERVRALPIQDIPKLAGSRDVVEGGIRYRLATTTQWVTDGATEAQCTTRNAGLDYLRATTTVTWPDPRRTGDPATDGKRSVAMTTLLTPTAGAGAKEAGSLAVHIVGRDGNGRGGITVSITLGETFTGTTNSNGCVVFPFVPAGNYQLRFQQTGMVDPDGRNEVTETVGVNEGQMNKVQYVYERGGTLTADFRTFSGPSAQANLPTRPRRIQVATGGGTQVGIDIGNASEWRTQSPLLFPALSAYAIYAGSCDDNQPPGGVTANVTPGANQHAGVVIVPALDITVADRNDSTLSGATVEVTANCGITYQRTTNSAGRLDDPGFPYSTAATVCVSHPNATYASGWTTRSGPRRWTGTIANTRMNGATQRTISLDSGASNGTC